MSAEAVAELEGDLKARILTVSTELFAERGYSATSISTVVDAAGCTKPALYYHFASKSALFQEALAHQVEPLNRRIRAALAAEAPVRERLTAAIRTTLDFAVDRPAGMTLMYRASRQPEEGQPSFDFERVEAEPLLWVREVIEEGIQDGEIREGVHVDDVVFVLAGLVDRKCEQLALQGDRDIADFPERAMEILFGGVAP